MHAPMRIEWQGWLGDTTGALSNSYAVYMDRELRITDPQIFGDPARNPQWIDRHSRTWSTEESPEDVYREHFGAFSTDALYATLDKPFLLLMVGQIIHGLLIDRTAWDASRIGRTATFLACFCSVCAASQPVDVVRETMAEWAAHFDETITALKQQRSAA